MLKNLMVSLSHSGNAIEVPSYENFKNRLNTNITNLFNWRKNEIFYLPSNLHLYSFIYSLPKSKDTTDYDVLNNYVFEYLRRTNSYGMSSIYNISPSIENGVLNGRCREQWIVVSDTTDHIITSVENIKPLRCIWHPFTTMNFWLDENIDILSNEVSFFTINLRELFIVLNHYYKKYSEFNTSDFITKILYNDLTEDIIDITLFNRMYTIFTNEAVINDPIRKKPIWMNLNDETDKYYINIIEELNKSNGGLHLISQNVKLSGNKSIYNFLNDLPLISQTKNITNLYFTALIRYIIALLDINKSIHGIDDITFNNHLKVFLNVIKNDWTLKHVDPDLADDRDELCDNLKYLIS